jgi:Mn2+/Fe2+ NRAMP family transporter
MNNFVGAMVAMDAIFEASNLTQSAGTGLRVMTAVILSVTVLIPLYIDRFELLCKVLGVTVIGMAIVFILVASEAPLSAQDIGEGFVPTLPADSSLLVVSLIGATSGPANIFLGSKIAKGNTMESMRYGVAFAAFMGGIISIIIVIAGTSIPTDDDDYEFTAQNLVNLFRDTLGEEAVAFFRIGLFCAAYTGCLSQALSGAIVAQGLLCPRERGDPRGQVENLKWEGSGSYFRGMLVAHIACGFLAASWYFDPVLVITVAQGTNGILLPFLVCCLYYCVNDPLLMASRPQSILFNVMLIPAMYVSMILAINALINILFSDLYEGDMTPLLISGGVALAWIISVMSYVALKTRDNAGWEEEDLEQRLLSDGDVSGGASKKTGLTTQQYTDGQK